MRKIYFLLLSTLIIQNTLAQDYSDPVADDEVIVEKPTDLIGSYRERRNRYGAIFSVNYEKYAPNDYFSLIKDEYFDEITDGGSVPVVGAELGMKFNFTMGSVAGLVGYGTGSYSNAAGGVEKISVKISKISANFALDNLMSEPLVAPYGQIGLSRFDWKEESYDVANNLKEESFTTDWNLNYKIGMLFQLNWIENSIDSNTHTNGLMASGLQNTFIDVFYTSYAEPAQVANVQGEIGDANLGSDNFGAGLKLEF